MRGLLIAVALASCSSEELKQQRRDREAKPMVIVSGSASGGITTDATATSRNTANEIERNIAVVDVDLATLETDYKTNEIAADDKYKDRVLRFTAAVHRIAKDDSGRPFLELQIGASHTFVHAVFESNGGLAALRPGQKVTTSCFCEGFVGRRLSLTSCGLVP